MYVKPLHKHLFKSKSQGKQLFVDVYDRHGSPIEWSQGDIAIVCNYRFAHGRPAITLNANEKRELGVIVGEAYSRVGALEGK